MSENFESMTVLELRRVAKEMGVPLGGGISKQGIIDKLNAARGDVPKSAQQPAPAAVPTIRPRVRSASIILDDDNWGDVDDVPVLTPNKAPVVPVPATFQPVSVAPAATPTPAPASVVRPAPAAAPAAAPAQKPSSLSTISSKAPAFTMEGARAWHNPRTYVPGGSNYQGGPYQQRPAWQQRPASAAGMTPRGPVSAAPMQQRPSVPPRTYQPAPQHFGPADAQQDMYQADYRPAPYDYPPTDYQQPQEPRAPYGARAEQNAPVKPYITEMLSAGECGDGAGVLDVHTDGFGFLRVGNLLPGSADVYISNAQIRRFKLRTGDYVEGKTRPQREGDRYAAMLYITKVNGVPIDDLGTRPSFEALTAIYPKKRLTLAPKDGSAMALRQIDLLAPLGFGQRVLVTLPSGADKSAFLTQITETIAQRHPSAKLMLMVIDERPEEVTLLRERVKGEVLYANVDESAENQVRLSDLALERAMRLTEMKRDTVLIVDNLVRVAHAYNIAAPQNARLLPCGLAASVASRLRQCFGAARMTKEGGSLTVLGLVPYERENAVADFILDEFTPVSNARWRISPAQDALKFDLKACLTMRAELQLPAEEQEAATALRALLAQPDGQEKVDALFKENATFAELKEKLGGEKAE